MCSVLCEIHKYIDTECISKMFVHNVFVFQQNIQWGFVTVVGGVALTVTMYFSAQSFFSHKPNELLTFVFWRHAVSGELVIHKRNYRWNWSIGNKAAGGVLSI